MRRHGHARVNALSPSAFGVCDRCGMLYNLDDLAYQIDWRGPRLAKLGIKVCSRCTDTPQIQNKTFVLPLDPPARIDPRPEYFDAEMGPQPPQPIYLTDENGVILLDEQGRPLLADGSPLPVPYWPTAPGLAPSIPIYLTDENGNVLLDDNGKPLLDDNSPLPT